MFVPVDTIVLRFHKQRGTIRLQVWQTASLYHLVHTAALLAALIAKHPNIVIELCRSLQEKRAAELRAEELETALMEMVNQDNRRQLSARIEQLERELVELQQALADKKEQESAMLQVLMRIEQEQHINEDARRSSEQEAAAQRCAVQVLQV